MVLRACLGGGGVPATCDPRDFPPIRRRIRVVFCTHRFISGANLIPSGFASSSLVLLNPNSIPMLHGPKLKQASSPSSYSHQPNRPSPGHGQSTSANPSHLPRTHASDEVQVQQQVSNICM
jgi:hypothetical protein